MNLSMIFYILVVVIACTVNRIIASKPCDIIQFTKHKNVGFQCSRGMTDNKTNQTLCTISCSGRFETHSADEYSCISTPDHPNGIWKPDAVPRCLRKDCDILQFTKGKNVGFQCSRGIHDNETSCTFSCSGEFKTRPADEYRCISTPDHPDGIWKPDAVPQCLRKDCNFYEMVKDKNVDWMCYRKKSNIQTFCTTYCINETTKAYEYTCAATEDYPMGIWTPDVVPDCVQKYEDTELCSTIPTFAKSYHNIGWKCIQHNNTDRTCKPYCKFTGKLLIPREYKCKVFKGIPGGKWHPEFLPGCGRARDECDMTMFTKDEDLGWNCKQDTYDMMSCTPYCKVEGEYLSEPGEYTCKVTPGGIRGGEWTPEFPPTCRKADSYELCDILEFAKDAHNIVWSCKQYNTDMTCKPYCNLPNGIVHSIEYKCKVSGGVRGGVWHPRYLPNCTCV